MNGVIDMGKKIIRALSMLLITCLMGTTAYASTLQEKKDVIEVEILLDSTDGDFAENIVFDDGTRLADYEYNITYVTDHQNPMTYATGLADYQNPMTYATGLNDYQNPAYGIMPMSYYPIGDYFNYAAWITRNGEISLSLDPKVSVRTTGAGRDAGWRAISSTTQGFGSHSYWKNTQVMKWQYECHYWFAEDKEYWNLEPHRTASSYAAVVVAKCNP